MRRELQRKVESADAEEIRFALKWAEATLKDWLRYHGEAALFVGEPRRTLDQNSKLWPMLQDVSRQVEWFVDGKLQKLAKEDWKEILTAALRKHQRVAAGVEGGFVLLGSRTSRMGKREFAELIEAIYAFGSERGVVWSEPAKKAYDECRRKEAA